METLIAKIKLLLEEQKQQKVQVAAKVKKAAMEHFQMKTELMKRYSLSSKSKICKAKSQRKTQVKNKAVKKLIWQTLSNHKHNPKVSYPAKFLTQTFRELNVKIKQNSSPIGKVEEKFDELIKEMDTVTTEKNDIKESIRLKLLKLDDTELNKINAILQSKEQQLQMKRNSNDDDRFRLNLQEARIHKKKELIENRKNKPKEKKKPAADVDEIGLPPIPEIGENYTQINKSDAITHGKNPKTQ